MSLPLSRKQVACRQDRQNFVSNKETPAYGYLPIYSGVCYNERILQRTVFINKIRMLQRTRRNTTGRRSTRVRMTCRAFPLWLERQSSSLLSFVRFSYQFSSVICLFVQGTKVK